MNIYTIGFTQKSAKEFFELLDVNKIKIVIDIRLNNSSQLAGFTKGRDLEYFLNRILNIKYFHELDLSPTKQILDDYKKNRISWEEYEVQFLKLLNDRKVKEKFLIQYGSNIEGICLLCSESTAEKCHRRLVAEYIRDSFYELNIKIINI